MKNKDSAVLDIGTTHQFYFRSARKAAQCFALLFEAKHVRRNYTGRADDTYTEQELIGRLQVEAVDSKSLRPAKTA
jgi:hypothetical protein